MFIYLFYFGNSAEVLSRWLMLPHVGYLIELAQGEAAQHSLRLVCIHLDGAQTISCQPWENDRWHFFYGLIHCKEQTRAEGTFPLTVLAAFCVKNLKVFSRLNEGCFLWVALCMCMWPWQFSQTNMSRFHSLLLPAVSPSRRPQLPLQFCSPCFFVPAVHIHHTARMEPAVAMERDLCPEFPSQLDTDY